MMRYQTAIPLSAIRGDDVGFRLGRKRRRRLRREAKRIVQREHEREAALQRLPGPPPASEGRAPHHGDREWGPLTRLGQQMRLQARRGYRAAVVELQPGMYLVAEVPEEALEPGVGVAPLLAPLLTMAAARALRKRGGPEPEPPCPSGRVVDVVDPAVIYEPPPPRQLPGPGAAARWVDPNDVQTVLAGCGCRRCGG